MYINTSNERKSDQLGMPIGRASGRLKKRILFSLVCRLKENICYRCKKIIETPEELSVDHKEPWLGLDSNLFWDLDNIAFSHLRCNVGCSRPRIGPRPKSFLPPNTRHLDAPEDTKWCVGCADYLCKSLFHKNGNRRDGIQAYCKDCRSKSRSKKFKYARLVERKTQRV